MSKKHNYIDSDDWKYYAITAYKKVDDPDNWEICPNCNLLPKIWIFDNGRSTACGCGESNYRHFSIHAESIASSMKHSYNGQSLADYNCDELRNNWNHWCKTGKILFEHANKRTDGKW